MMIMKVILKMGKDDDDDDYHNHDVSICLVKLFLLVRICSV